MPGSARCRAAEVTYRNSDSIHTEVAQSEDAGPIGHNANLGVRIWPIPEHGTNRAPLLDRDVQGLGPRVQRRILETYVTNGWRVDQGHHLLGVIDEQSVEEVVVLSLDR